VRPVFVQEEYQRFDSIDGKKIFELHDGGEIVVTEKNIFEMNGGGITVTEGGSVSLTCRAIGYPDVKYEWEKNGAPLSETHRISLIWLIQLRFRNRQTLHR
jgi:hypothetical protein